MKNDEYVQYIVVRKDLISQMGVGKTAAQVAHASIGVIISSRVRDANVYEYYRDHPNVEKWLNGRFTKLIVYVKSKEKLLNLASKLDKKQIETKLIFDACFTVLTPEEEDGTTLTCMGVIPIYRDIVPKCLRKLQLLD